MKEVTDYLVTPADSIRECVSRIDSQGDGIVLVVDDAGRLMETVTDGDIRRAMLAGLDIQLPLAELLAKKVPAAHPTPITAPVGTPARELLELMSEWRIRHVPLVDSEGRPVQVSVLADLVDQHDAPLSALVMAGGRGSRLRPLTDDLPKPMLPVGDHPLLELIISRLRDAGIRSVKVATHYAAEAISSHFGDGSDMGMNIDYVAEEEPLGTAGALGLLKDVEFPLLVMNGDILTDLDYGAMLRFHKEHSADATVAVVDHEVSVPYGVCLMDGTSIRGLDEKPRAHYFINAGIYLLEETALAMVPKRRRLEMTDLLEALIREGHTVIGFPLREYWRDIGRPGDYSEAIRHVAAGGNTE